MGLGCSEPEPEIFIRPVRSILVGDVSVFDSGPYPGQANALQEVDLGFEVSGQLIERPVVAGDLVQPGRLLARLDPRDYEARLASAAGVHGTAKANYQRAMVLVREGALAEIVLDQRRAVFEAADGELRLAQKAFDDTRMYAPFAGTVSVTYVDNFQNVQAKQSVIRLLDVSKIEMQVGIPEDAITLLPYITGVKVRFDAFPDREFPAEIREIGAEPSRTTRTYPVTLIIDPPEDIEIKPGMAGQASASAVLPEDLNRTGIEIPASAVFSPPDQASQQSFVWILAGEPLIVSRREVKLLGTSKRGVLVRGLAPGDRIATAGVHSLSESQHVRLLDSGNPS
jgi:RND family efflux transporter MFP subunit